MRIPIRLFSTAAHLHPRPPWTPPSTLKYALRDIGKETIKPSGWSPPMGGTECLPFSVFRTPKAKQIPVYTDYRNGRTRCMTVVRRFRGDANELAEEMSRICDDRPVTIRPGSVQVVGNYRARVEEWLLRLGF
ncbi:Ribosomal protein L49/IMG2 [Gracilaria domingensis]|nr:Ribosomal protein L49/IMG2 [Gracilaria domingensis]